jgi:hypothetical protein
MTIVERKQIGNLPYEIDARYFKYPRTSLPPHLFEQIGDQHRLRLGYGEIRCTIAVRCSKRFPCDLKLEFFESGPASLISRPRTTRVTIRTCGRWDLMKHRRFRLAISRARQQSSALMARSRARG